MNNIFSNGQKTKLVDGTVTNNNAFQMSVDQIVMNNGQLNERLENLDRPKTYNDIMMEQKFQNMNLIDLNVNKQIIHHGGDPSLERYWEQQNGVKVNDWNMMSGGLTHHNNMMMTGGITGGIHPALIQFNNSLETKPLENDKEELHDPESIYKDIIEVMEDRGDERHANSDFLKFIKKLDVGDIKINEKLNDIEIVKDSTLPGGTKLIQHEEENMDEMWDTLEQNLHNIDMTEEKNLFLKSNPYLDQDADLISLAKENISKNQSQDARYALEAEVQKTPENSEAWLMLGKIHTENDRDDLAMECFSRALKEDPFNAEALLHLGISCTNEFDEFDAMVHLKNWIKLHGEYHVYYDDSNILLNHDIIRKEMFTERDDEDVYTKGLRIENLKSNFYKEMLIMMENIALHHPTDSDLWIALGIAHFIPHENGRAIECFREAVKINPKDYNAWNKLGAILAHSKMHGEAIQTYQKAIDLKPDYARCWANMGIAHFSIDSFEKATQCFIRALQIYPEIPHVWSYLNSVLFSMKRFELTEYTYTQNLKMLISKLGY
jgi:Flp pilus assembly protein TadD